MTIAISIKVNDGVVLAADSASTLLSTVSQGVQGVVNVYENANKVANLHKALPVGIITWGSGSIGKASISTLIKDFRKRIMREYSKDSDWEIDVSKYSVKDIANRFKEFIYDEMYQQAFPDPNQKPVLGFVIAGYSTGSDMAEEWRIIIDANGCHGPTEVRPLDVCGLSWNGEPEAITRLYFGFGSRLPNVLKDCGLDDPKIKEIMDKARVDLNAQMVFDPMPIQDTIDLAKFLVDLTKNFLKFIPGAPTVGGATEIAAITKHEGYKWVSRKFYYDQKYNLGGVQVGI